MMDYITRRKKYISLVFGVLVVVIVVFIGIFSNQIENIEGILYESDELRQAGLEEYKQLGLYMNQSFLNAVEYDWEIYNQNFNYLHDDDRYNYIQGFINNKVRSLENTSEHFVIAITDNGQIFYFNPTNERYEKIKIENLDYSEDEINVLFEEKEGSPFGEGDRFYYNSRKLIFEDTTLIVYVGFLECIIYENYAEYMDFDILKFARTYIEKTIFHISLFMFITIVLGIVILYNLYKLGSRFAVNDLVDDFPEILLLNLLESDQELKQYLEEKITNCNDQSTENLIKRVKEYIKEQS